MKTAVNSRAGDLFRTKPMWTIAVAMALVLGLSTAVVWSPPAFAAEVKLGPLEGCIDMTVSIGAALRIEEQDLTIIGHANGGDAFSINYDNGNLNYDQWDFTSLTAKVTQEIELGWNNFTFFGRWYYFNDWAITTIEPERTPFTDIAEKHAGRDIRFLDAFVKTDFDVFDKPVSLRLGNQVVSWGESTFIQNGINVINPVNVAQLHVAGAELREAFIPVPMAYLNANLTNNLSIEGFYQFMWEKTEIEPEGTFFGTKDHVGPGADRVYLGFGLCDGPSDWPPAEPNQDPPIGSFVPRERDHRADNQGQGGVALRLFAPWLMDTEFGLFWVHYHSRRPILSGRTSVAPPAPANPTTPQEWIALLRYGLIDGDAASTANYFREYPEDIDMVGASFNTNIGAIGLALQGEVSYRMNQPLQVDDVELLFAALSPMDDHLRTLSEISAMLGGEEWTDPETIFARSQLGTYGWEEEVPGYRRKDVIQPQMTLTKLFGPVLGADQVVTIGEVAGTYIFDMEDKSELRYEGPATYTSGNDWFTNAGLQPVTTTNGFADDFSWGYRVAARADFNNAIGAVNLSPAVAFAHDVQGITPAPLANFVEGQMKVTVALAASYLNSLQAKLSYTMFFGGTDMELLALGESDTMEEIIIENGNNLLKDRDFLSFTISYSF